MTKPPQAQANYLVVAFCESMYNSDSDIAITNHHPDTTFSSVRQNENGRFTSPGFKFPVLLHQT